MNSEVSYQTGGIGAETSAGGVRMNMIPREGGNRWSGDFKFASRPGAWQSSNLTQRHKDRALSAGNAIDRILDYTFALGGPIKKDKLWVFGTTRYFSVNNYIANTFMDDGNQGIDDQFILNGMARLTWQVSPRNKISAYFDEVHKYRGHDMQSNYDPETAATVWNSPAYHTTAVKWTSPVSSSVFVEAGFSNNTEYYTNEYREGIEKPRGSAEWFATAARNELDLNGYTQAGPSNLTESPVAFYWNTALTWVKGDHTFKIGANNRQGTFKHTRDHNADLILQYRSSSTGVRWTVPDSVSIRNTPLTYGERLNRDLGIFIQDSWRLKRLTANVGLRWETLNAKVLAGKSPAGRWVPERVFEEIADVPDWNDFAPRMALVYDLFGNGATAVKYSLNRYNQSRTTGIAANYNPLRLETATLPWRDVNGNGMADATMRCTGYPSAACEIDFAGLATNYGTAALNEYGEYPRTWNLESGLEVQHELLPGMSVAVGWWKGWFHNLTTTINQSWSHADYTEQTWYNPVTGQPFPVYARALGARPTRNLDTFDPDRQQIYEAFNVESRWRIPGGGQIGGGIAIERERQTNCTSPDDPNYQTATTGVFYGQAMCDDFALDIPYRPSLKLSGTREIGWGVNLSFSYQNNASPTSSRLITATRGVTRYPANCPAPCPAGQIIMPSNVYGQASMSMLLESPRVSSVERIAQLDFKVARAFRFGRYSVLPTFEVFNINNSDAIISYVSTNVLSAGYLAPNSIMQGRIFGFGVVTRW
jgi:hypothetical protein